MSLFPKLGTGVGLRREHVAEMVAYAQQPQTSTPVQFLEVISENYFPQGAGWGDPALKTLDLLRERFPIILHGTSLALGNALPLDPAYLACLKRLIERYQPALISDHLCWGHVPHTSQSNHALHDLLPVPYHASMLQHLVQRITHVQETLGHRLCIENVSAYVDFQWSTMTEAAFLSALAVQADCGILLDVNNVYVNAVNQGFDAHDYLRQLPWDRVAYIHLAGHHRHGELLIDTHDQAVCEEVWELYRFALSQGGPLSTCLEWDAHLPSLSVLEDTLHRAQGYQRHVKGAEPPVLQVPDLAEWQAGFAQLISEARGSAHVLKHRPKMARWFKGNRAQVSERLEIYAEGYFWRLQDNLKRLYPRINQRLSEKEWFSLCARFYDRHPPQGACIQSSGEAFADDLAQYPVKGHPDLAALAHLEHGLFTVLHSDEPTQIPLSAAALAEASEVEQAQWAPLFSPLYMFSQAWCFPLSSLLTASADPLHGENLPQQGVIYKTHHQLHVLALDPLSYAFLKSCQKHTLAEACNHISASFPTFDEAHLTTLLTQWQQAHLLRGLIPTQERRFHALPQFFTTG